ncbi:hypothetical protein C1H21_01495 [Xanthomonas arboricola pv. juglandis]|nr:hypothetical protein C1H21_01495 [Xanthomonas arboricola pv. juglandis]
MGFFFATAQDYLNTAARDSSVRSCAFDYPTCLVVGCLSGVVQHLQRSHSTIAFYNDVAAS